MTSEKFYPVVGRSDTGKVALRLPVEVLQTKDEQFSLFVISLLMIQGRLNSIASLQLQNVLQPPEAANFYNIAAIHGRPYSEWLGDYKVNKTDYSAQDERDTLPIPSRFGGYCNNLSESKPLSLRKNSTDKREGQDGQKPLPNYVFRTYWDWAELKVGVEGLPAVLYEDTISIAVPREITGEEKVDIDNPLAFSPINPIPPDFNDEDNGENVTSYFKYWGRSLRYPRSDRAAERSRTDYLQRELKARFPDIRRKVAALFTFDSDMDPNRVWDEFSNHSPVTISKSSDKYHGSLEGVHDSMHDILGGIGHMAFPDYAGFDPIFFLHHCNVDRLYALWEYCYANENKGVGYWMGNGYSVKRGEETILAPWLQPQGTYASVYNAQLLPSSALAPFRVKDGYYWSSDDSRYFDSNSIREKYYTYETACIEVNKDAPDYERISARKRLQEYYGYTPAARKISYGLPAEVDIPGNVEIIKNHRQFAVIVELLEHANNGPYAFKLFGKPNARNPEMSLIGAVSVFARQDSSPCAGCQGRRAQGTTILGIIFVDEDFVEGIVEDGGHGGLDDIAESLKRSLHAELHDPRGLKLSVTLDLDSEQGQHSSELIYPRGVELVSTGAASLRDNPDAPYQWVGWTTHGSIFRKHDWKRGSN